MFRPIRFLGLRSFGLPAGCAILAASCLLYTGCSSDAPSNSVSAKGETTPVDAYRAEAIPSERRISASGTLLANESVDLRAEQSGRITELRFDEGQKVSKGMLLLQIDDSEYRAQLRMLEARLLTAEADLHRKSELLKIQGVSQENYDLAVQSVESLLAEQELVHSRLRNCRIEAPFSGKIGLRYVSPGSFLTSGDPIAQLVQDDPIKIEFPVPQRYAHLISTGKEIGLQLEGLDSSLTAEVYAKEARIDPGTRTLTVRARCANPEGILLPGSFVEVDLLLETITDALMVPSNLLVPQLRGDKVLLMKNGLVVSREVETGLRSPSEVQITSGIQAGDTLIASALLSLKDGMSVELRTLLNEDQR